jgi:hypothetical protein
VSPAPPAAAERLLDCVRLLAPLVDAERPGLDARRELSPSLLEALHTAGRFRLWLPRRWSSVGPAPRARGGADLR